MSLKRHYRYFSGIPFVRDIFTMQIGRGVYMGLTLLTSIVFARTLGLDRYGTYAVILSFVSTIKTFTNLGQSTALQIFFAEEYGKRDRAGMAAVLRNFINVSVINGLFLIALAILAPTISILLYGSPKIGFYARFLFIFSSIDILNSGVIIIVQAVRQVRLKTILEQSANATFLLLASVMLLLGHGIGGVITSQLVESMVFVIISLVVYHRTAVSLGLPRLPDLLSVRSARTLQFFRQGLLFSIDKNIGGLYPSGLFFALSLVAAPAVVGIARLALQLANLSQSILLPQVNELSTTVLASMANQKQVLRRSALKIIKHALFFHILISVASIACIPFLIPLLYGQKYAAAIPMTLWLILLSLPAPIAVINSPLLRVYRKVQFSLVITVTNLILMWSTILFLSRILTPQGSFLLAYFIGQATPLILTAYLLLHLLSDKNE